jgi:hypothetical protein
MTELDPRSLALITGGYDLGRTLDAGNAMAKKGAMAGGFVGGATGAFLSQAVAEGIKIPKVPSTWIGAAAGAGLGTAIGGGLGWTAGAGIDVYQQIKGVPAPKAE